jgi:hypothetical protein
MVDLVAVVVVVEGSDDDDGAKKQPPMLSWTLLGRFVLVMSPHGQQMEREGTGFIIKSVPDMYSCNFKPLEPHLAPIVAAVSRCMPPILLSAPPVVDGAALVRHVCAIFHDHRTDKEESDDDGDANRHPNVVAVHSTAKIGNVRLSDQQLDHIVLWLLGGNPNDFLHNNQLLSADGLIVIVVIWGNHSHDMRAFCVPFSTATIADVLLGIGSNKVDPLSHIATNLELPYDANFFDSSISCLPLHTVACPHAVVTCCIW